MSLTVDVGVYPVFQARQKKAVEYEQTETNVNCSYAKPDGVTRGYIEDYLYTDPRGDDKLYIGRTQSGNFRWFFVNWDLDATYYSDGETDPSAHADRYIQHYDIHLYNTAESYSTTTGYNPPARALSVDRVYFERATPTVTAASLTENGDITYYGVNRGQVHIVFTCEEIHYIYDVDGTTVIGWYFTTYQTETVTNHNTTGRAVPADTVQTAMKNIELNEI